MWIWQDEGGHDPIILTIFIAFEMAPKCVQLSLSEKSAIAALHNSTGNGTPAANNIWCLKTF
jgi:hypothetical protein